MRRTWCGRVLLWPTSKSCLLNMSAYWHKRDLYWAWKVEGTWDRSMFLRWDTSERVVRLFGTEKIWFKGLHCSSLQVSIRANGVDLGIWMACCETFSTMAAHLFRPLLSIIPSISSNSDLNWGCAEISPLPWKLAGVEKETLNSSKGWMVISASDDT